MTKNKTFPKKLFLSISIESWISIANLVLTMVIGIVIAILLKRSEQNFQADLQKKDQDFQVTLQTRDENLQATLQARDEALQKSLVELQITANQANIQISHHMNMDSRGNAYALLQNNDGNEIKVANIGNTVADNVTITICLTSVNPAWQEIITSIDKFDIKQLNTAILSASSYTTLNCEFEFSEKGNNAFRLKIDKLPPGQEAEITIILKDINHFDDSYSTINAFMVIPQTELTKDAEIRWLRMTSVVYTMPPLTNLIMSKLSVAQFNASASCDNCNVRSDLHSVMIPTIYSIGALDDFKIIDILPSNQVRISGKLLVGYKSPQKITNDFSMYFIGNTNQSNILEFDEMDKPLKNYYFP